MFARLLRYAPTALLVITFASTSFCHEFVHSLYVRERGWADIFVVEVNDLGNVVRADNITNHPAHDMNPRWSPDGSRILFKSNRDDALRLYTMTATGADVRPLTLDDRIGPGVGYPAWSRDGKTIAVTLPGSRVYVIDAATGATELVYADRFGPTFTHCRWSPDGKRLALSVPVRDGGGALRILDLETRRMFDLADAQWIDWHQIGLLALSADGRAIVVYSDDSVETDRYPIPDNMDVLTFDASPYGIREVALFVKEPNAYMLHFWDFRRPRPVRTNANLAYADWRPDALPTPSRRTTPSLWSALKTRGIGR